MASNSVKLKVEDADKLSLFIMKYGRLVLGLVIAAVVLAAGTICYFSYASKSVDKGLSALYEIEYRLTDNSGELSEEELEKRRASALEEAAGLCSQGGVVGLRANMLAAELCFQSKKYAEAAEYWQAAAAVKSAGYDAPLSLFNAAVALENGGDDKKAADLYKAACLTEGFYLSAHAGFSAGRVFERLKDYDSALEMYEKILGDDPMNPWAELGHSRAVYIEANGLASEKK